MKRNLQTLLALLILLVGFAGFCAFGELIRPEQDEPVQERRIPSSCAIVATEAYERIFATGAWCRMIGVYFILPGSMQIYGHMMVVWQPHRSKSILIFDEALISSTMELPVETKRDPKSIALALNKLRGPNGPIIISARFIQP